jgi:hypothetical protein
MSRPCLLELLVPTGVSLPGPVRSECFSSAVAGQATSGTRQPPRLGVAAAFSYFSGLMRSGPRSA